MTSSSPALKASAVVWTGFMETCGTECVGGKIKRASSNCRGGGGGAFEGVTKALKKHLK